AEVGVQNDPIHAIVAAAQEILIQSAQPLCHGGYARRTPAYFKLPRRGHFFAARSAKKRSLLCRFSVAMLALLASPSKNAPSIATSVPPSRSRRRASRTKSRLAAFSPAALSLRKLAIVR